MLVNRLGTATTKPLSAISSGASTPTAGWFDAGEGFHRRAQPSGLVRGKTASTAFADSSPAGLAALLHQGGQFMTPMSALSSLKGGVTVGSRAIINGRRVVMGPSGAWSLDPLETHSVQEHVRLTAQNDQRLETVQRTIGKNVAARKALEDRKSALGISDVTEALSKLRSAYGEVDKTVEMAKLLAERARKGYGLGDVWALPTTLDSANGIVEYRGDWNKPPVIVNVNTGQLRDAAGVWHRWDSEWAYDNARDFFIPPAQHDPSHDL